MKIKRLRDLSIGFKLWLLFICFVIPCILLLGLCFRQVLGYTRDEEVFASIESAQKLLSSENLSGTVVNSEAYDASISVYHIGIVSHKVKYMTFPNTSYGLLLTPLIEKMTTGFSSQPAGTRKYKYVTKNYALYYIVKKSGDDGVISFKLDVPMDSVYHSAFIVLAIFTGAAVLLSVLLSLLFLRILMRPIKRYERSIAGMAAGDLQTSVALDRGDEFGRLSREMDRMRLQLARRDLLRQAELQYVSHELKTPLMTILSYAQSIVDRVYPRENAEGSAEVIISQTRRMQRTVMKLLTLTKLDYLRSRPSTAETTDLKALCTEVSQRICASRPELAPQLRFEQASVLANRGQLEVLFENLFENALRHADHVLSATLETQEAGVVFTIFNDGGGIDEAVMPVLFEAFKKGAGGVTGLGLSIVKRAAEDCGAEVSAENRDGGVAFTVAFGRPQGALPGARSSQNKF
ncbi:MAG: HAMP domain-containing sensor histidine kinase [Clostridia bacterium]|nr:HAMP domain-containing sensor histidine kinase [Clostridia bacterium]MDR3644413.1 HAMP domain-containing sensor histidine kinase [Clostridia bacterium]